MDISGSNTDRVYKSDAFESPSPQPGDAGAEDNATAPESQPPLTFADLGIPQVTQMQDTVVGKVRINSQYIFSYYL